MKQEHAYLAGMSDSVSAINYDRSSIALSADITAGDLAQHR